MRPGPRLRPLLLVPAFALLVFAEPVGAAQDRGRPVATDGPAIVVEPSPQPEAEPDDHGSALPLDHDPVAGGRNPIAGVFRGLGRALKWTAVQVRRSIIGEGDDRRPVSDHLAFPYRAMVSVVSLNSEHCTGWLYGPRIVATAGHCVHSGSALGRWRPLDSFRIVPAHFGPRGQTASAPFGTCRAVRLFSTAGWTEDEDEEYDYGAIELDCEVGKTTGWLGLGWTRDDLLSVPMTMVGYRAMARADRCKGLGGDFLLACQGPGQIRDTAERQLFYDADTSPETSGGPVLDADLFAPRVLGIHGQHQHPRAGPAHEKWNHGVRITRQVFENLRAWRRATLRE